MRRELSQMPDLPATRWRRRLTEAQIFEGEGNLPAAISSYRDSATLIEQERRTLPSDVARAGFTNDKVHVFDRLVLTLLSQGDYAEAFRWNEQARARTMTEMLSSAAVQLPTDTERRLYSEFTAARAANQAAFAANDTAGVEAADGTVRWSPCPHPAGGAAHVRARGGAAGITRSAASHDANRALRSRLLLS